MTVHDKFIDDMEEAGFEVEHNYNGRYHWTGPGVSCGRDELQDVIRATPIRLQRDELGKGLIVYPVASAAEEWAG